MCLAASQFWPWVANKAEASSTYHGEQHFRSADGEHIGAPRDGIPRDSKDAATETIPDNEVRAACRGAFIACD
jgi:hypothetical protein